MQALFFFFHLCILYLTGLYPGVIQRVHTATAGRDDEIVKEYLSHFMREAKSSSEFEGYFDFKNFLGPLLARVMLMSGDQNTAKWYVPTCYGMNTILCGKKP